MPKEKREMYDIERIATLFRNVMFGMALLLILGLVLSKGLNNPNIEAYVLFGVLLIGIPYLIIKSNSKTYKMKKDR